jgi:hypothetical protein
VQQELPSAADLRDVIARQAVADLLVDYVLALDRRDWPAVAGCFAADAVFVHPGGRVDGDRLRRHADRWEIHERVQEYSWRSGNPGVIVR